MNDARREREEIDALVAGQTVCSMFQDTVRRAGTREALQWKTGAEWRALTWDVYGQQVRNFANGLLALGLKPGEFLNILAANRPEYYVVDLGALHAGVVPVSLYNSLAADQIEYIVNHCEAACVVVENRAFFERLRAIRDKLPTVRSVIMLDAHDVPRGDPWVQSFDAVIAAGQAYGHAHPDAFDASWQAVTPDGLATLIYTSGTTGPPKGVMVSHYNVVWTAESLSRVAPRDPGMRHISYLPLAHIAERMVGHYLHIHGASTCYFCPAPQQITEYLVDVRPEFFFAVPRIWEKMHSALTAAIETSLPEEQRVVVQEAIAVGLQRVRLEQQGRPVPSDLGAQSARAQQVTAMIRQRVGLDQVKIASTGAAPIATEILEWFHAVGVPITEVYGQSEDSGPTSWNRLGAAKLGTVGPRVPGVEVRLADDGELLVRGGNVTQGYYKEPALTAETFDAEGWLHSGDVAEIDSDGFIKIVDRKKEILITAGGKNIAPSNIENMLKQTPLIGQACVIGDRRPFVSALLVLDAEAAVPWAKGKGLPADVTALAAHPAVHEELQRAIDGINEHLNNVERVKRFVLLPNEWTPESGELTPTLKMKRKVVNQRYADAIESMYR